MGIAQSSAFCLNCNRSTLITKQTPNHALHAVLTLLCCGLWLVPWFAVTAAGAPWRCATCGRSRFKRTPVNSALWIIGGLALAFVAFVLLGLMAHSYTPSSEPPPIPVKRR